MKIAVIGLGSMGKRRIRLIQKYNKNYEIIGIDLQENRRREAEKLYGILTAADLKTVFSEQKIDAVFISSSPLSHAGIIENCLEQGIHIFSELNLTADGYEKNIRLAKEKEKVLFLSSTFLYRDEIRFMREQVEKQKGKLGYQYHVGQYLPDWHPWERYQNFFIGKKETNGCREIFAIELPWLISVFGEITGIEVIRRKISKLEIDFDDQYLLLLQHENGHAGTLIVDVVARKAVRNFELTGEELYLRWDGSPTGLFLYDIEKKQEKNIKLYEEIDKIEGYCSFVVENAYYHEIVNFFETISGKSEAKYSFEMDKKILDWIDVIEGKVQMII